MRHRQSEYFLKKKEEYLKHLNELSIAKGNKAKKICPQCQTEFLPTNPRRKYCTSVCAGDANNQIQKEKGYHKEKNFKAKCVRAGVEYQPRA